MINLKNLQFLYVGDLSDIDPTLLSNLQQLKEVHINRRSDLVWLFEEKQRLGRADLKIYLGGLLLNGPYDPVIDVLGHSSSHLSIGELDCLMENRARLSSEISLYDTLVYSNIDRRVPLDSKKKADLLKRFTDLKKVTVSNRVRDI